MGRFAPAFMLAGVVLLSCALAAQPAYQSLVQPIADCANIDSASSNYFPAPFQITSTSPAVVTKVYTEVTVAQDFAVQYYSNFKVVTNKLANATYVLIQCGTTRNVSEDATLSALVTGGAKVFQIPLVSVSTEDSTAGAFMTALGVSDRTAFASEFAVAPCQQKLASSCNRAVIDSYSASTNKTLLQTQQSQLATVSAVFTSSKGDNAKAIAFTAVQDPGNMARAEWLKFMAVFFNKEYEANLLFSKISSAYSTLQAQASVRSADAGPKPVVAWLSVQQYMASYGDSWTGTGVALFFTLYKTQDMQAGGGTTLDKAAILKEYGDSGLVVPEPYSPDVNLLINVTADPVKAYAILHKILATVDVVVDESSYFNVPVASNITLADFASLYNYTNAALAKTTFGANKAIYRLDGELSGTGGYSWFQESVVRPDEVLVDFVLALNPATAPAGATPRWLRPLVGGAVTTVTAASCSLYATCELPAAVGICPFAYKNCTSDDLVPATPELRCAPSCTASPPVAATPAPPVTAEPSATPTSDAEPLLGALPWLSALLACVPLALAL